jgi:ribosomal protein S18 acetylase RimI-like enzyme
MNGFARNNLKKLLQELNVCWARAGVDLMAWKERPGPRVASPQDRDDVVSILVGAFHDDPTWSWAFPDPSLRAGQLSRLWGMFVDGAMRFPWVWLSQANTATSVWIPPNEAELSLDQEAALEPALVEMLGQGASRVLNMIELFDQAHPRGVPHFYLSLLATSTQFRNHGYGLRLLADNLREIDESGMPCYLEASNPVNVPLYARHGFEVLGSFSLPESGIEVFTMWREGAPAT